MMIIQIMTLSVLATPVLSMMTQEESIDVAVDRFLAIRRNDIAERIRQQGLGRLERQESLNGNGIFEQAWKAEGLALDVYIKEQLHQFEGDDQQRRNRDADLFKLIKEYEGLKIQKDKILAKLDSETLLELPKREGRLDDEIENYRRLRQVTKTQIERIESDWAKVDAKNKIKLGEIDRIHEQHQNNLSTFRDVLNNPEPQPHAAHGAMTKEEVVAHVRKEIKGCKREIRKQIKRAKTFKLVVKDNECKANAELAELRKYRNSLRDEQKRLEDAKKSLKKDKNWGRREKYRRKFLLTDGIMIKKENEIFGLIVWE